MADKAILVIDQGGQSTRAVIYNSHGEILAKAQCAISHKAQGLRLEHNLDEILQSVLSVTGKAYAQLNAKQQAILTGAALIVQRASFVALDKTHGKALSEVISWQDTRNIQCPAIDDQKLWQQQLTGLRPNAHLCASKMRWLLEQNPAVKHANACDNLLFMPLGGVIAAFLTGTKPEFIEPSLAQRTGLFDINQQRFSGGLCRHYQVPKKAMPKVCNSLRNWGEVEILAQALPLLLVTGDQNALPFASGKSSQLTVANIGTGAFVLSPCANDCKAPGGLLKTLLFSDENQSYFALEGTVNNAANSLHALLKQQGQKFNADKLAEALQQETNHGVCDNRLHGTGSPFWLAAKPLAFYGAETNRQQQVAVLESIVFALAINLSAMAEKQTIKKVLVAGGLSHFDGLCQRLANITGMEIVRGESSELSSEAAAVLCLPETYKAQSLISFVPVNDIALTERFQFFKQLLP